MDLLESANARTIEADPIAEQVVFEIFYGNGKVLPHSREINKPEVNDLDARILGEFSNLGGSTWHTAHSFSIVVVRLILDAEKTIGGEGMILLPRIILFETEIILPCSKEPIKISKKLQKVAPQPL